MCWARSTGKIDRVRIPCGLPVAWGEWFTDHPEIADWSVAAGTALLAIATFVLAWQARAEARQVAREAELSASQIEISRASLAAQTRPILIDVQPMADDREQELIPYERQWARNVPRSAVHVGETDGERNFVCSVPLRNAGLGLAFLKDNPRLRHPARDGELIGRLTKQVVPSQEQTRAFFGPAIPLDTPPDASLILRVPYTDTSGEITLWTEAVLQFRDNLWRVARVAISLEGQDEPLVTSAAAV